MTRTIKRNIMLMSAREVARSTRAIFASRAGEKGSGMRAMSDPKIAKTNPAITALIVPARLNPKIKPNLVMGVTR